MEAAKVVAEEVEGVCKGDEQACKNIVCHSLPSGRLLESMSGLSVAPVTPGVNPPGETLVYVVARKQDQPVSECCGRFKVEVHFAIGFVGQAPSEFIDSK